MSDRPIGTLAYILELDSPLADLASVGGKGANLSLLARAGYPVPGGFLVTTRAYRRYTEFNGLDERIQTAIESLQSANPEALEQTSEAIRALFRAGTMPDELAGELRQAYARVQDRPVAVRSSATAEDLPEMSFAGQQDTYLNIIGEDALFKAVVDCWGSLWTARAIGYRRRNLVADSGTALAVVVQEMVDSRASGVLFTANPLTGLRTETVIDATLGLGEALVSGQVEPDHYVVDASAGQILARRLGAKALAIQPRPGGGTQVELQDRRAQQALPDAQVLELARLGQQVGELYAVPQDIEWAEAGGKLYLLQSRPVTSLFPLPAGAAAEPLKVWFSFGAVQGLLDPMTPLGRHALEIIFAAPAGLFGIRFNARTQTVLYTAGERLWLNMTTPLSNTLGRKVIQTVIGMVEPTIGQALTQIWDDPRLQPRKAGISLHGRSRLVRFFIPLAGHVILNLLAPKARRKSIVGRGEQVLAQLKTSCAAVQGDRYEKLAQRADLLALVVESQMRPTFLRFVSCIAAAMASWNLLNVLTGKIPAENFSRLGKSRMDFILEVTRGMPFNPTTEMDLALWEMAQTVRGDAACMQASANSAEELAAQYRTGGLPERFQRLVDCFLDKYGGRGLGEIDMGRVRWAENPSYVFEMLSSFLRIDNASLAPDFVFAKGAKAAEKAVDVLVQAARQAPHGWLRAKLVRFFAGRARDLMGARESPKFFVVRLMWLVQRELRKSGQEFVESAQLGEADDLFFLSLDEIKAFAAREQRDWAGLIAARREVYKREQRRKQIPRLLLSDGRAFYEGLASAADGSSDLQGSPVSPGSAEGWVRVVLDPREAHLQPGEILVCPGTDPSWTPLFLSAGGLVMEVGGMMTHGAVVAREYGIPAIVGVDRATTRLQTGQRIRMDGSSGKILLLDEPTQT